MLFKTGRYKLRFTLTVLFLASVENKKKTREFYQRMIITLFKYKLPDDPAKKGKIIAKKLDDRLQNDDVFLQISLNDLFFINHVFS